MQNTYKKIIKVVRNVMQLQLSSVCNLVWHNVIFICDAITAIYMITNKLSINRIPSSWNINY